MPDVIDTHGHLDELENVEAALQAARQAGVVAVIAAGIGYESNLRTLELAARHAGFVYPALGLHPGELGNQDSAGVERTLHQIEDNLQRAVAVGEVGLDYHKGVRAAAPKERQHAVLRELLAIARRHGKPALLHTRYAWKDSFDLAREADVAAVFHWFTGPSSVLREIVAAGYYLSATPAVAYHTEHRRAVGDAPPDRLLLETDSPVSYLSPGTQERYRAQPSDVLRVLKAAAALRGVEEAALAQATTDNAMRLFKLA